MQSTTDNAALVALLKAIRCYGLSAEFCLDHMN